MIGVMHIGIVLSKIMGWNSMAVFFMVMTLVSYELSSGPICYIHVSEVATDVSMGLCMLVLNGFIVLLNLATEPLIHTKEFGLAGVFGMLSVLSFLGAIFIWIYMGRTEGLSDIEKKTLYMPKEEREKRIREASGPN